MTLVRQIFLDLDGPLLDGKDRHYHCYKSILEKFGYKPIDIDEYWQNKRAMMNRKDLLDLSGAREIYDDFLNEWLNTIESPEMLSLDKIQEGAIDCLQNWKAQGIILTLVTMRKNKHALEQQLQSMGLSQYLDNVLVCDHSEGGEGKANAVRSMFKVSTLAANSLWIGDTEADWEGGNSLGIKVILVANGLRNIEYLTTIKGAQITPSMHSNLIKA